MMSVDGALVVQGARGSKTRHLREFPQTRCPRECRKTRCLRDSQKTPRVRSKRHAVRVMRPDHAIKPGWTILGLHCQRGDDLMRHA